MFFKKKSDANKSEEILLISNAKNNRYERELRDRFMSQLNPTFVSTKIQIKKLKIQSRIDEYDDLSIELVSGLCYQLAQKLGHDAIYIGTLTIKAIQNNIEIQMSHLTSKNISFIANKRYKTGFGTWAVISADTTVLSAEFDKNRYLEFVNKSSQRNEARGIHHV